MQNNKKIKIYSELLYICAVLLLALAVSMLTAADFGVSMIVAPAYLLSRKLEFLSFGQCEYILQGCLFIVFCLLMKKIRAVYFSSFVTCLLYGSVLDCWREFIPLFNPNITSPGSMSIALRVILFVFGMLLTSFSVSLFFKTYLYPQVYDFFVKGMSQRFNKDRTKFKTAFDMSCLLIAVIMSLLLFKGFVGINFGTVIMACFNGTIIGFFTKLADKYFVVVPIFKKFAEHFDLTEK